MHLVQVNVGIRMTARVWVVVRVEEPMHHSMLSAMAIWGLIFMNNWRLDETIDRDKSVRDRVTPMILPIYNPDITGN